MMAGWDKTKQGSKQPLGKGGSRKSPRTTTEDLIPDVWVQLQKQNEEENTSLP